MKERCWHVSKEIYEVELPQAVSKVWLTHYLGSCSFVRNRENRCCMKPLIVLLVSFVLSLLILQLVFHRMDMALAGRIAMSIMLLFTAVAHFAFTEGMTMMLPDFIPFKKAVVYLTGLLEIAAAIGLLIPGIRIATGWMLIVFFLVLLPANIQAAMKGVDYQKGTLTGKKLNYLWFRVPLQILFIIWVYISAIKYN